MQIIVYPIIALKLVFTIQGIVRGYLLSKYMNRRSTLGDKSVSEHSAEKVKGEAVVVNPLDAGMLEGGLKPVSRNDNQTDGGGGGGAVEMRSVFISSKMTST